MVDNSTYRHERVNEGFPKSPGFIQSVPKIISYFALVKSYKVGHFFLGHCAVLLVVLNNIEIYTTNHHSMTKLFNRARQLNICFKVSFALFPAYRYP